MDASFQSRCRNTVRCTDYLTRHVSLGVGGAGGEAAPHAPREVLGAGRRVHPRGRGAVPTPRSAGRQAPGPASRDPRRVGRAFGIFFLVRKRKGMWLLLPESRTNSILGGYRNPAPNEPIAESLLNALKTSAFVTAEIVQFEGAGERKLKLDCHHPPTYLVSDSNPSRWVIRRNVLQMSGLWHPVVPPRKLMLFHTDFGVGDAGGETMQVSIPGKRIVRVIKKCSKWNKIRKISPKVGKLAIAFKELWALSQERHYAPGGQGYQQAAERFIKRQKTC